MTNTDCVQQLNSLKKKCIETIEEMKINIFSKISDINNQYLKTFSKYEIGDVVSFENNGEIEVHQITNIIFQYDWVKPTDNYKIILIFLEDEVVEEDLFLIYVTRKYQKSGVLGIKYNQIYNIEDGLKVGESKDFDTPIKVRNQLRLFKNKV